MKKIHILAISCSVLLAFSCTLERSDYTEITEDQLFRSEADIALQVNALYQDWDLYTWLNQCTFSGYTAGTTGSPWIGYDSQYQQWTVTSGIQSHAWTEFERYAYLSQAREVIRGIEKSDVSDNVKALYLGEAKALRGFMAVHLYNYFGPVPVASDDLLDNPEDFVYIGRLSEDEYEDLVVSELSDAIELLPVKPAARGRVSKGFAMMTLLRYYMIRGKFSPAEQLARDIVNLGCYSLQDSFAYLFSMEGQGNSEIIWQLPANKSSRLWNNFVPASALPTDMPWTAKSTGWGAGHYMYWNFYDSYEAGDKRLVNVFDGYTNANGKVYTRDDLNGAIPIKYGKNEEMVGDECPSDMIIYRYADVLLRLAECIARNNGGVPTEAVDLVNRVRSRAGISELSAEATASSEAFLEAILWERLHELFMEGWEREDEIRFGVYVDWCNARINAANAEKGLGLYNIDESHNRLFIPQGFIDESMNKIIQNEGY